jgi:hypothetical protein
VVSFAIYVLNSISGGEEVSIWDGCQGGIPSLDLTDEGQSGFSGAVLITLLQLGGEPAQENTSRGSESTGRRRRPVHLFFQDVSNLGLVVGAIGEATLRRKSRCKLTKRADNTSEAPQQVDEQNTKVWKKRRRQGSPPADAGKLKWPKRCRNLPRKTRKTQ